MTENKNTGSRLLGDIGESIVAYELFKRGFSVAINKLSGYDILCEKNGIFLKIEVKVQEMNLQRFGKRFGKSLIILLQIKKFGYSWEIYCLKSILKKNWVGINLSLMLFKPLTSSMQQCRVLHLLGLSSE
ncbi:hypothetical protein LCGC14_1691130 [marine sediment metagenome]|uniref:Uncharacterized protein n=1 Tax=marine sediment metagenome TaxID=412755 RepID=A0A0F9HL62_9ZZZZ